MRLKEPFRSPSEGWVFYYQTLAEPPVVGRVSGSHLDDLTAKVGLTLKQLGIPVPDNLKQIVEHQICLRQPEPTSVCWNSGAGDALHHDWIAPSLKKVASLMDSMPKIRVVTKLAQAVKNVTGKISGCSSCGGTVIYNPSVNNLGRAGKLNQFLK